MEEVGVEQWAELEITLIAVNRSLGGGSEHLGPGVHDRAVLIGLALEHAQLGGVALPVAVTRTEWRCHPPVEFVEAGRHRRGGVRATGETQVDVGAAVAAQ